MELSLSDIAYMLKSGKVEIVKQMSLKETDFRFILIPITEIYYTNIYGRKVRRGPIVRKFEEIFFYEPLLSLAQQHSDWVNLNDVARKSGNYKAFCSYLDVLYRRHPPTNRHEKLVEFRDAKNKWDEETCQQHIWMLATTGSKLYYRRKRQWGPRIFFRPDWNRMEKKLNSSVFSGLKDSDYYHAEAQNKALRKLLSYLCQKG